MYKLKKVYAILAIKNKNIDLTIFDKSNGFLTCLFDKSINFSNYESIDDLSKIVEDIIIEADNFIGIKIKRILLEISNDNLLDTNNKLNDKIKQILSKNNLEILSTSYKEEFFASVIEEGNQMIINVDENISSINHYKNNQLIKSNRAKIGYGALINYISSKTLINNKTVLNIIKNIDFSCFEKYDFPLTTIFHNRYLSINQINSKKMQTIINNGVNKLKNILENEIRKSCDEIKTYYQNHIYINTNDISQSIFSNNLKNVFFNGVKMKEIDCKKIIGINKAKSSECTAFINWYEKNNQYTKYSIDPFVSQDVTSEQIKKDLIIKLGIITTKLSAKLGS